MPAVVKDIVAKIINELSQVPGIATQIYSSDRIRQFVENAYLIEETEMWWPQYMWYSDPIPIDGATGLLTQDLVGPISAIDDYTDIRVVWPDGRNKPLRELSPSVNPTTLSQGVRGWFMTPDYTIPHRPIKVLPVGGVQSVVVHALQHTATPFSDKTVVYIDPLLLMYDACWMYAVDDATIPAQVQKYQMLAQKRRTRMIAQTGNQPLELDPRYPAGDVIDSGQNDFFVLDQDPLA